MSELDRSIQIERLNILKDFIDKSIDDISFSSKIGNEQFKNNFGTVGKILTYCPEINHPDFKLLGYEYNRDGYVDYNSYCFRF